MSLEILFLKMANLQHPIRNDFCTSPEALHKKYSTDLSENLAECCLDALLRNNVAIFRDIKNLFCSKQKTVFFRLKIRF